MLETQELWLMLCIILTFVGFISGLFLGASFSPGRERAARGAGDARLTKAEPRHDERREAYLPAAALALVVVSGGIVLDRFKGPLFPDVFYCLNDGGTQTTRMCTGRV